MGNKQSSEGGGPGQRSSDPTSRSFSWQPDPLFAPLNPYPDLSPTHPYPPPPKRYGSMSVLNDPNIQHSGPTPFNQGRSPHSPNRGFPPQNRSNGSVIIDEAVFGGVKPMPPFGMKGTPKRSPDGPERSQQGREDQQWKTSENSNSPARGSRPGTSDSGYFTGMDSDAKMRSRLRGSRLSLNEAIFDSHPQQHSMPSPSSGNSNYRGAGMGPPGPYPPHMFPPPHFGGPMSAMQMRPPPEGFLMGPYPPDSKKGKKWRKKKKSKIEKWNSTHLRSESMPPFRNESGEPIMPGYGMGPGWRAQSVDNFGDLGLLPPGVGAPPFFPPHPPPPEHAKRFSSQMDLSGGMPPPWIRPVPPGFPGQPGFPGPPPSQFTPEPQTPKRKGKGPRIPSKSAPGSEKQSISSGRGSKREKEATHFEEERLDIQDMAPLDSSNAHRNGSDSRNGTPLIPFGIYESLRGQHQNVGGSGVPSERTSVVATVEVAQNIPKPESEKENREEKGNKDRRKSDAPETIRIDDLPLKISAEAQAVFERNERLLGYVETQQDSPKHDPEFDAKKKNHHANEAEKFAHPVGKVSAEIQKPVPIDGSGELELVPIRHPVLLPRKKTKQKDFEPLEAWRGINVDRAVRERQPQRDKTDTIPSVEEKIFVRLTPVLPSRSDTQGEPIYSEYDERLSEFKIRLIETGSFDIPGKFRHQPSNGGPVDSPSSASPALPRRNNPRHDHLDNPIAYRNNSRERDRSQGVVEEMGRRVSDARVSENKESLVQSRDPVTGTHHSRSKSTELDEDIRIRASPLSKKRGSGNVLDLQQYQSTGSLTPSNANTEGTRGGESSEIDFSWVHDLETKFRMDEFGGGGIGTGTGKEGRQSQEVSLDAHIRKGFESHFQGMNPQQPEASAVFRTGHCEAAVPSTSQEGMKFPQNGTRYFGMTGHRPASTPSSGLIGSSSYEVSHMTKAARESELNQLETNVRLKAALFEQEAAKLQSLEESRNEKMPPTNRTPNMNRRAENGQAFAEMNEMSASSHFSSDPRTSLQYPNGPTQHQYLPSNRDYESPIARIAANVQTTLDQRPRYVEEDQSSSNNSFRSPSERKIHRLEQQRREGWVNGLGPAQQQQQVVRKGAESGEGVRESPDLRTLNPPHGAGGAKFSQDSRLAAYHVNGKSGPNPQNDAEAQLQKSRVYNATEFYRHNYQDDRNNRGAERWRANGQAPFPYASQPALYNGPFGNARPIGPSSAAFQNGNHYKSSEWY